MTSHFLFVLPAMIFALWAQFKVKTAYAQASRIRAQSGLSGAQAAAAILEAAGVTSVGIEQGHGLLSDHYDPKRKVLRLSRDVYQGNSLASVGIAAHEAGHALQDRDGYAPLVIRNGIVPLASLGSGLAWVFFILGFVIHSFHLIVLGIGLFSLFVFFQLINLPVEFNASKRAKELLLSRGIVLSSEKGAIDSVLDAAALTYVAATLAAVLDLVWFLIQAGILGGNRQK